MKTSTALVLVICNAACHACRSNGGLPGAAPGAAVGSLTVTSNSFSSNGSIPVDHTCDGADRSPHLAFSAPPAGTQTFAIVVDDPDAPGGSFTHWIAYNLHGDVRAVPEGADVATLGGVAGTNDFNRPGYGGPCPPRGEVHRYSFRVFALNASIDVPANATRNVVDGAMNGHVLAQGALVGVFAH
jgi:Raf kinase inhibitor-like YbhB/YbcL family protein